HSPPGAARVGTMPREPLGNRFLTVHIHLAATLPMGDGRHRWPPSMIAGRGAVAERLSFLVKPNRTMAQAALRFVLAFPETSLAIPGAKTDAQVDENVGAADAPPLTDSEIKESRALYAKDFGC